MKENRKIQEMSVLLEAPIQFLGSGLVQEAVNKLIAGLGAGVLAWFVSKWYHDRESRGNKLDRTHRALFGIDDIDTVEGVVEIIEAHDEDIDNLYEMIEEGKEKREELEQRLTAVKQKVENRHNSKNDGGSV